VTSNTVDWYQLVKAPGAGVATVRFENTTPPGRACSQLSVNLDTNTGTNLDGTSLNDDTAVTYSVNTGGLYYVEVSPYNCSGTDGATYSIEASPSAEWTAISLLHPVLAGSPRVGSILSVTHGSWSPAASSYGYQWYLGHSKIPGAISSHYKLVAKDVRQSGIYSGGKRAERAMIHH
jgi:hypothetical protein